METLVNMTVRPQDILIGDLICCNGTVARVVFIFELWTGCFKFLVCNPDSNVNYIYDCPEFRTVKLLSI